MSLIPPPNAEISTSDQAKLDAAEPIGVTAAIAHLQETNAPSISERIIQAFLCNKPDAEATRLADVAPKMLAALRELRDSIPQGESSGLRQWVETVIAEAEGRAG